MSEKTFSFEILTLQKLFMQQDVQFVIAPGQEGLFEILPNHAPYVFGLQPGAIRIQTTQATDDSIAVGGGFLIVQKERTTVLTRSAERSEDIDVERAKQAKQRAEERLNQPSKDLDFSRAQAALQRAIARLKVAGSTTSSS